ncbi:Slc24a1 [Symbiodinium sp. CCMP2592]|nr:Slc24a1 [Symbiodinium sp. CCMP2592]
MGCAGSAAARYEEAAADGPEAAESAEASWPRGEWRVEVAQDDWIALDQETSQKLLEEYYSGRTEATYSSFNNNYHVDFYGQVQTDQQTGRQCRICWFEAAEIPKSETAGQEEVTAAPEVYLGGEWLIEESSDVWRSLDPEVSAQLLVAYYCGDERMEYTLEGKSYEVDLTSWEQLSRESGKKQRIFWNSSDPQAADEATELPDSRRESEASDQWLEPGEEAERQLLAALASGQEVVRYFVNGCEFEVDVVRLVQTNLSTGEQWMIAVEGGEVPSSTVPSATAPPEAPPEVAPEASVQEPAAAEVRAGADGSSAFAAGASEPRAVPTAKGKPKAFIYKAVPDATKQPPKKKKWSLAPGQQRTRIAGPKPKAVPGPQRPGPPGQPTAAKAAIELPKGVEWPKADKARRVAETVFQDMRKPEPTECAELEQKFPLARVQGLFSSGGVVGLSKSGAAACEALP